MCNSGEARLGLYPSDPREFIELSKWSTGAWTYQEALLSRTLLDFTDQQVYYERHGMYCC
jgi:hypothetical protein